ncbi:MAG: LCP family protein [Chloroflexi bacterium]|nr:LCP family protein [Chloroflexota bacterium]
MMTERLRLILPATVLLLLAGAVLLGARQAGDASAALQATAPPTNTPRATIPPTNTPRVLASPTDPATATTPPTETLIPSETPVPTETFTPTPTEPPFLPTPSLYYPPDYEPRQPQPTAIPTPMPRFRSTDESGQPYEILNVLLLGHDGEVEPGQMFHTDTMIVVSINRDTNTVSMISLPRDLFVYIPNWGMQRLNLAWGYGDTLGWTDGAWGFMRQTLLYNFGLETHYYAMVDFTGFERIIDELGGVTVAVDCPIQDQVCVENCDDGVAGNETYELQTLPVGVFHMDGEEALWYARSRKNTIDFDRGRRQQQILRAMWAQARDSGVITQLPNLYDELTSVVETNMPLPEILPLIPLALSIEPNDIENHFFRKNVETVAWSPDGVTNVQLPHPDGGMQRLIFEFLAPPTQNRLRLEDARIEIFNGTANDGWDMVATDRLVWEGFAPVPMGAPEGEAVPQTMIYDYTGSTKGSSLGELVSLLNIRPENIILKPDPNRTMDFKIVLGTDYNSCVDRQWVDPANLN